MLKHTLSTLALTLAATSALAESAKPRMGAIPSEACTIKAMVAQAMDTSTKPEAPALRDTTLAEMHAMGCFPATITAETTTKEVR
jgi:hypothetical protein